LFVTGTSAVSRVKMLKRVDVLRCLGPRRI